MGIAIDDDKLFTLHFADDQIIFAEDEYDIEYMVKKLDKEYTEWGLTINMDKTEYLVVGGDSKNLKLDRRIIRGVDNYKYLGTTITKNGSCDTEVQNKNKARKTSNHTTTRNTLEPADQATNENQIIQDHC